MHSLCSVHVYNVHVSMVIVIIIRVGVSVKYRILRLLANWNFVWSNVLVITGKIKMIYQISHIPRLLMFFGRVGTLYNVNNNLCIIILSVYIVK